MTCLTGNMGNPPDADEPLDPIELVGYAASDMTTGHNADRLVPLEPTCCLGFTCPARSDACDVCQIAKKADDTLDDEDEGDSDDDFFLFRDSADEFPQRFAEEDRFDYRYDTFPTPSMGRGKRATATRLTACS